MFVCFVKNSTFDYRFANATHKLAITSGDY